MTSIKTGDNDSYIEFHEGGIEFMADGGSNEREFHEAELNKEKTKELYKAMKEYYEPVKPGEFKLSVEDLKSVLFAGTLLDGSNKADLAEAEKDMLLAIVELSKVLKIQVSEVVTLLKSKKGEEPK